jgi:excisionase family DNA binding protein
MNTTRDPVKQPPTRRTKAPLGPWLSPPEAARYLGIGRTQVYELMNTDRLPFYELDDTRGRRVRVADLDRLLRRRLAS